MSRSPDPYIRIRLGPELKARFIASCKAADVAPSTVMKEAITAQVGGPGGAEPPPAFRQVDAVEAGPKVALRLWVTESERAAIDARAKHSRCSRAAWAIGAVRAALTGDPQLGADELEHLGRSNTELLAIGRNLNQISRRLNEGQLQQQVTAGLVEELSQRIDEHIESIRWVMRASRERWSLR